MISRMVWLLLICGGTMGLLWWGNTAVQATPQEPTSGRIDCEDGLAGDYPCHNINLLGHLSLAEMGVTDSSLRATGHWGWRDEGNNGEHGREYVLIGLGDRTGFVDITDPETPVFLGHLPAHQPDGQSDWWDIHIYQHYAYIVADVPSDNGIQIFDLTQLRHLTGTLPVTFTASAHYGDIDTGHNLWINADTGYLYTVWTTGDECAPGIRILSLADPLNPTFVACFGDPPLSDAECLLYEGPDKAYHGRELCFLSSDDNISIYDVTDKENITRTATFMYPGIHRAHQGTLTDDHRYWFMTDMMDEMMHGHNTRLYIMDIQQIEQPQYVGYFEYDTAAMDHDILVKGDLAYQANLQAGLRVLHLGDVGTVGLEEVAYFDVVPESDSPIMNGAWNPFLRWGNEKQVTVSSTGGGLYILEVDLPAVLKPSRLYLPLITVVDTE